MISNTEKVQLPFCSMFLRLNQPLSNRAPKANLLRGSLSQDFDHPLMHQHQDGKLLYRYPLVQYRWDSSRGLPVLFGIGEGAEYLLSLPLLGHELRLGKDLRQITEIHTEMELTYFALEDSHYRFSTPWIPFKTFNDLRAMEKRELEGALQKRFIANVLIAARALGVHIGWRVEAEVQVRDLVQITHKRIKREGVFATVHANTRFPNHIGLGVAPSHGFGWLVRK